MNLTLENFLILCYSEFIFGEYNMFIWPYGFYENAHINPKINKISFNFNKNESECVYMYGVIGDHNENDISAMFVMKYE